MARHCKTCRFEWADQLSPGWCRFPFPIGGTSYTSPHSPLHDRSNQVKAGKTKLPSIKPERRSPDPARCCEPMERAGSETGAPMASFHRLFPPNPMQRSIAEHLINPKESDLIQPNPSCNGINFTPSPRSGQVKPGKTEFSNPHVHRSSSLSSSWLILKCLTLSPRPPSAPPRLRGEYQHSRGYTPVRLVNRKSKISSFLAPFIATVSAT